MVEAYQKGPRVFPTKPIQGPSTAPSTVSLATPHSWSEWNPEQYGSLPSDLAVQQGEMMQMMWNQTPLTTTETFAMMSEDRNALTGIPSGQAREFGGVEDQD
eukprot:5287616-Amphidinium_carterae.1